MLKVGKAKMDGSIAQLRNEVAHRPHLGTPCAAAHAHTHAAGTGNVAGMTRNDSQSVTRTRHPAGPPCPHVATSVRLPPPAAGQASDPKAAGRGEEGRPTLENRLLFTRRREVPPLGGGGA